MKTFINVQHKPKIIHSDNGSEFKNNELKAWCESLNIKQLYSEPYKPLGQIERFNKSLKSWIFKHFTMYQTTIWVDYLPKLVEYYNENKPSLPKGRDKPPPPKNKNDITYQIGDSVRISNATKKSYRKVVIFQKSYKPNWSTTIYEIVDIINNLPQVKYQIEGPSGIKSRLYYQHELQVVPKDTVKTRRERSVYDNTLFNREAHVRQTLPQAKKSAKTKDKQLPTTALAERIPRERRNVGSWWEVQK